MLLHGLNQERVVRVALRGWYVLLQDKPDAGIGCGATRDAGAVKRQRKKRCRRSRVVARFALATGIVFPRPIPAEGVENNCVAGLLMLKNITGHAAPVAAGPAEISIKPTGADKCRCNHHPQGSRKDQSSARYELLDEGQPLTSKQDSRRQTH